MMKRFFKNYKLFNFILRYGIYFSLAYIIFYQYKYIDKYLYWVYIFVTNNKCFSAFILVFLVYLIFYLFSNINHKIYSIRKICRSYLPILILPIIYLITYTLYCCEFWYYILFFTTIVLSLDVICNIEYICYKRCVYYLINILPCILFCFSKDIDIEGDFPITNSQEDILGRTDFINILKRKFMNIDKEKGFAFLLSAGWGEGKTSCINLLKEKLRKENLFEFIDINPWFNDTKEKLLNAVLGEINTFAKSFYPYKSFESEFDDIVKLTNIKLTNHLEIALQNILENFTKDNNIQHKIKNIGKILKNEYSKRIVIVLDDIDRLSKEHILYILQVVQMFKQYTNIIFVLSVNYNKIENILCEISDPCVKNNNINNNDIGIKKALYYKNYLEKIASIIIPLPKIEDIDIQNILFEKINDILQEEQMPKITRKDFDFYIATSRFKTIRDIKRFCNTFFISYAQVKDEINIFNYINISILFVFYLDIYNEAWKNQYKWFKCKINIQDDKQLIPIKQYFKDITEKYDGEDIENINELITLISPVYEQIPAEEGKHYLKMANKEAKSYFVDDRYLQYYFTHNFSKNRIPDKILDERLQSWFNEKDEIIREKNILNFMQEYSSKLSDFFRYLNIYYDEKYSILFKQIILIFAKNSFDLSRDFYGTIEYISKIISRLNKYQAMSVNNFLIEIINRSSSVSFSIELYKDFDYNYKGLLDNPSINNLLDEKISNNVEKALESFEYIRYNRYLYLWLQKCYVAQISEIKDIIDLQFKDYILIREKVKKALSYIKNDIELFMLFIGENIEQTIKGYREDKTLKNRYLNNFMHYIDIWGENNISQLLEFFLNNGKGMNYDYSVVKLIDLYRIILNDRTVEETIKEHEEKLVDKIITYDLTKNMDVKIVSPIIGNFKLDFAYNYNDTIYYVSIQRSLKINSIFINELIKNIGSSHNYNEIICFYYITSTEEEKIKLENDLNEFVSNLSAKNKFIFEVKIKKNLLEKY